MYFLGYVLIIYLKSLASLRKIPTFVQRFKSVRTLKSNVLYKIDVVGKFIQVRGAITLDIHPCKGMVVQLNNSKESLILAQDER
jgi:hypothetical protein